MKYLIFFISFFSLNACAGSSECQKLSTQLEMTNCSINKLSAIEKQLKEQIDKLSSILSEDKDFALANKNWIDYRDSHCASVANIYLGGSIYNYILTECKYSQTLIRIKTLDNDYRDSIDIITKGSP